MLKSLREIDKLVPESEVDLHRRFNQLASSVDYTAWQPSATWPGPNSLCIALGITPGARRPQPIPHPARKLEP